MTKPNQGAHPKPSKPVIERLPKGMLELIAMADTLRAEIRACRLSGVAMPQTRIDELLESLAICTADAQRYWNDFPPADLDAVRRARTLLLDVQAGRSRFRRDPEGHRGSTNEQLATGKPASNPKFQKAGIVTGG